MKPFAHDARLETFPVIEAAPARARIRVLAAAVLVVLTILGARAVQLSFAGDPTAPRAQRSGAAQPARADIVDRNGILLATTVRAFVLTAAPDRVWNARETAAALVRKFPDLDRAATERRLADRSRQLVYLRRGLTESQRQGVMSLGLGGIGFETEERRAYPNGALAGHALGYTSLDLNPLAGVERGMDRAIRASGEDPVRLSIDVRIQYAAEAELARAAQISQARGGAVVVMNARTGEVLAMASWPALDPNNPGEATRAQTRNRVSGERYEMGSTIKPFTAAMALELGLTNEGERFDLAQAFDVDGHSIVDHERTPPSSGVREILVHSSNKGAAMLALRVGRQRQRTYLERLGLLRASPLQLAENAAPIAPRMQSRLDVATLGFGYGLATSPAALAGAYTVFANGGAYVRPTLLAYKDGDPIERAPVFSPDTTRRVISMMRATVMRGTGREADVPGLEIAGKTGTAEKLGGTAGYDQDSMFSSFAAIFPASDPRYVIVLALDEPARTAATGGHATGGAVAARPVGRIAARIAPMLGLRAASPAGAE
ncbi:MAG: penicillin-binding protein 2 [Caulobacterales bacterium]